MLFGLAPVRTEVSPHSSLARRFPCLATSLPQFGLQVALLAYVRVTRVADLQLTFIYSKSNNCCAMPNHGRTVLLATFRCTGNVVRTVDTG
ncbi:unnamed protein product, partial [Urochloa humidicola]